MGRVFTVDFYYYGTLQSAMVSVGRVEEEPSFHIQLHDKALDQVLSVPTFRYKGIDGYQKLKQYQGEKAQRDLLEAIGKEIEKHMTKG